MPGIKAASARATKAWAEAWDRSFIRTHLHPATYVLMHMHSSYFTAPLTVQLGVELCVAILCLLCGVIVMGLVWFR